MIFLWFPMIYDPPSQHEVLGEPRWSLDASQSLEILAGPGMLSLNRKPTWVCRNQIRFENWRKIVISPVSFAFFVNYWLIIGSNWLVNTLELLWVIIISANWLSFPTNIARFPKIFMPIPTPASVWGGPVNCIGGPVILWKPVDARQMVLGCPSDGPWMPVGKVPRS